MNIAPGALRALASRVPPAEVARLVRLLESTFEVRDTAQVRTRETHSDYQNA